MYKNGRYIDPAIYSPWEMTRCILSFPPHPFRLIKQMYSNVKASNILTKRSIQFWRTLNKVDKHGIDSLKHPNKFKELCKTYPLYAEEFSKLMHSCPNQETKQHFYDIFNITEGDLAHNFGRTMDECHKLQAMKDPRKLNKFKKEIKQNLMKGDFSYTDKFNFSVGEKQKLDMNFDRYKNKYTKKIKRQKSVDNIKNKVASACKSAAKNATNKKSPTRSADAR